MEARWVKTEEQIATYSGLAPVRDIAWTSAHSITKSIPGRSKGLIVVLHLGSFLAGHAGATFVVVGRVTGGDVVVGVVQDQRGSGSFAANVLLPATGCSVVLLLGYLGG